MDKKQAWHETISPTLQEQFVALKVQIRQETINEVFDFLGGAFSFAYNKPPLDVLRAAAKKFDYEVPVSTLDTKVDVYVTTREKLK